MGGLDRMENVELLGWDSEPQRIMSTCHVFLRLTRDDAYAGTVRDAQAMRRIVLFTKPVGDCLQVSDSDFNDCKAAFFEIVTAFHQQNTARISELRSDGNSVPTIDRCTRELSDYVLGPHA